MFKLSQASMVKNSTAQNGVTLYTEKSQTHKVT